MTWFDFIQQTSAAAKIKYLLHQEIQSQDQLKAQNKYETNDTSSDVPTHAYMNVDFCPTSHWEDQKSG